MFSTAAQVSSCFGEYRQCFHLRWSNSLCHRLKFAASVESALIILLTVFQSLPWLAPLKSRACLFISPSHLLMLGKQHGKKKKKQRAEFLNNLAEAFVRKQLLVEFRSTLPSVGYTTNKHLNFFFSLHMWVSLLFLYGYACRAPFNGEISGKALQMLRYEELKKENQRDWHVITFTCPGRCFTSRFLCWCVFNSEHFCQSQLAPRTFVTQGVTVPCHHLLAGEEEEEGAWTQMHLSYFCCFRYHFEFFFFFTIDVTKDIHCNHL